jgi:preprotein translocase subunit SecF
MEFIKPDINIDFIGKRKIAFRLSLAGILGTIILLIFNGGPNLGVDFSGGLLIQIQMESAHSPAKIKEALTPLSLQESIIQEFGEKDDFEYLIRITEADIQLTGLSESVRTTLREQFREDVEIRRDEGVGPSVSEDLRQKALFAIFYAILFIAIYISGRFELKWLMSIVMAVSLALVVYIASGLGVSITWLIIAVSLALVVYIASGLGVSITWLIIVAMIVTIGLCWLLDLKYAMGAIIALIHDVTITIGAFTLTDREISLAIIAAILTIVGYSLNDTIVVFDRIRENLRRFRKRELEDVINASINETLSRTILTSTTTLIVVVALFVLGGGIIHDFSFAILIGVLVGTYSSIFVASPIILAWEGGLKKRGKR